MEKDNKQLLDQVKKSRGELENIINYHNKNLTKEQYYILLRYTETLENVFKLLPF